MCGIAGIMTLDHSPVSGSDLATMIATMPYRGPDDRGVLVESGVGLGHLRLSIIDVTSAGHQPMTFDESTIVFNGEIYNYIELREELRTRGRTFATNTDTEVILQAYNEWGERCVERFNGMWAFVLYDKKNDMLFASRDRFGVKPLYFVRSEKEIIFASEMKAILAIRPVYKKPNLTYLYNSLDRNTPTGCSDTVFAGIQTLLPGHRMRIGADRIPHLARYWEYGRGQHHDDRNPRQTFRDLFIDSIRLRLRSDVPVGVCLSGGMDSSIITCVLARVFGIRPETFSSIYHEPECNEERYIDAVNQWTGASSHKITPTTENFFTLLNAIIAHHDEPVRMPSCYTQWHVMQLAQGHATVLLDGQGGDEILAGYPAYVPYYLASLVRDSMRGRSPVANVREFFASMSIIRHTHPDRYLARTAHILAPAFVRRFKEAVRPKIVWQDAILSDPFRREVVRYSEECPRMFTDPLNQELYRTVAATNLPMLLEFEDRISMAFSLEARTPFLDYRLVEYCLNLPRKFKIRPEDGHMLTKVLLRESFQDILPPEIYKRKDKKGFPTPNAHWFRHELKDDLLALFGSKQLGDHGVFNPKKVMELFQSHLGGRDHSRLLWRVMTTELWMRQYFD